MKHYKAIIFDWDGTIMNSEARIVDALQMAARQCDMPVLPPEECKQIIGLALDKAILNLYPQLESDSTKLEQMCSAYTESFLVESETQMEPFDGAEAMLLGLRQAGKKLAIATGKSRRGLNEVLDKTGFGVYFDMTRTPVESASKPDPLMLSQILAEFDLSVEEAVMVGDTTFDMEMAQNLGMDRIALSHGCHDEERLMAYQPVAMCHSLQELYQVLA